MIYSSLTYQCKVQQLSFLSLVHNTVCEQLLLCWIEWPCRCWEGSVLWLQSSGSLSGTGWLKVMVSQAHVCFLVFIGCWWGYFGRLTQPSLHGGSIPRKLSQCACDFQGSTFILFSSIPESKASHVASPKSHGRNLCGGFGTGCLISWRPLL